MAAGIIDVAHRASVLASPGSESPSRRLDRMAPAVQDEVERAIGDLGSSLRRMAAQDQSIRRDRAGRSIAATIEGLSPSPRNLISAPELMVREPMAGLGLTE